MIRHRLCVYLSATLMVFGAANAAVGASLDPTFDPARDEALREQQRQIQLEQQRLEQERLAREGARQAPPPTDLSSPQSADETKGSDSGPCQNIAQIDLVGTTLINENERLRLVSPFLDRCLNATDINALLQAVGQWYFERGYISSRAYLQPQDLTDGSLVVQVIEGSIEGIDAVDLSHRNLRQAFPQAADGLLNLRDIEQGLDQVNRLSSKQSTMQLIPGAGAGGSRIQVTTQTGRRIDANISIDNLGQDSTGEDQARFSLSMDNPIDRLGFLSASYSRQIHNRASDIYSRSASWHYDWPYRYWNVDLDASWFSYSSIVSAFSSSFVSSGVSRSQSVRVSRLLHRNQNAKLGARWSVRRSDTLSFIEGSRVDTSSRTLVSNSLELWHQYYLSAGIWSNAFTWQKGVDWFDGVANTRPQSTDSTDGPEDPQIPESEYSKFSINSSLSLGLPSTWIFNRYRAQLSGQYANVLLFGPDQISVGSAYSVRGFKGSGHASNKGAYIRQDFSKALAIPDGSLLRKVAGATSVEISLGLDGGVTRSQPGEPSKYLRFSGRSIALSMAMGRKGSLSIEYAKPLSYPKSLPTFAGTPPKSDLYLRGTYVF